MLSVILGVLLLAADYTAIPNQATLPILNPSLADAKSEKIRLENGLEAYLVSDPATDKSSAALTVLVGSWDEPEEYPGLAHFLEHMLFLGTKKYPKESEYDRFITEHGGLANAFTVSDATSFMFEVENSAFPEALDRFSNFFKEPLFNPSGVARELQAIDQEYAKNRENDSYREIYVLKELADPDHPFHAFSAGNSASLEKVSQETLKEFYQKHYSANLMRLTVISPLPLEEMKKMVVADFKDVPNHNLKRLELEKSIFSGSKKPLFTLIEPVKNVRSLSLIWHLPAKFAQMEGAKPETVVCYVLGDEGKNSLLAQLKKENLAESLQCGSLQMSPSDMLFYIGVDLTDEGVNQVNTVIERLFQTLAIFKQKGVPEYLYKDVQKITRMRYQYQNREEAFETIMKHATWMAHEEMSTYPERSQVILSPNPQAVSELLQALTPKTVLIDLVAPETVLGTNFERKEKWNKVGYTVKAVPDELLKQWETAQPFPGIDLPEENPYLPSELHLVNVHTAGTHSTIPETKVIQESPKGKVYFAADDRFLTPKVGWKIVIKTPEIDMGDPRKVVLGDLFVKAVKESLNAAIYPAQVAGLDFEMERGEEGIEITINGYSETAPKLLKEILLHLQSLNPEEALFSIYKDSQKRDYENFAKETPLKQASELVKDVLYKDFVTAEEKSHAIAKIDFSQFREYAARVLQQSYVQAILYGNMTEEQAQAVANELLTAFDAPYPKEKQPKIEVVLLPANEGPFYLDQKIASEGNAAILTIEYPTFSFRNRAAQQVLMQALGEPFFANLRTKQQTGYIVYNIGEELEKKLFNFFAVQSNTHDPRDLLARFELFIENYLQEISQEISESRFATIRDALIVTLENPAKNPKTMAELLYQLGFKFKGDFKWLDKRIAGFKELQYPEFLTLAHEMLGKKNRRRLSILTYGILNPETRFEYTELPNVNRLKALSQYESGNIK